jgi:pyrroline-5-carboxylate reductase
MAAAMARGWAAGEGGPDAMVFCDVDRERAEALAADVGGETRERLRDVARDTDIVAIAVKPAALDEVAEQLDGDLPALISVLAATPLARLREVFPGVAVLRVMPNQPVQVRRGVICYVPPAEMPAELESKLLEMLGVLGTLVPVEEEDIDAAMAVMSCTPAYFAAIARALARAGEREGLDGGSASGLVAETMAGTAELLRVRDPDAIESAVAPPGGATEAGLKALERGGVDDALAAAVRASLERFR